MMKGKTCTTHVVKVGGLWECFSFKVFSGRGTIRDEGPEVTDHK